MDNQVGNTIEFLHLISDRCSSLIARTAIDPIYFFNKSVPVSSYSSPFRNSKISPGEILVFVKVFLYRVRLLILFR